MDINEYVAYWKLRLERDIASFADPNTRVSVLQSGRTLQTQWVHRTEEREAVISVSMDNVSVSYKNVNYSYRSFLASEEMGDLRGLAQMISRAHRSSIYVSTKAAISENPRDAISLLNDISKNDAAIGTAVVMVTGEAGAGKTVVLKELVRTQAEEYLRGQADRLFLYVNAQGRALARLNEALSTELVDLRATPGLNYHSIATLARLGMIVLVIDGFDELLGVSGYDDAFSSLASFLEQMESQGSLIASARSAYYEEEFVARANRLPKSFGQSWTLTPVHVLGWSEAERGAYVDARLKGESTENRGEVKGRLEQTFSSGNSDLGRKPLFVAKTLELLVEGVVLAGADDLLRRLVEVFLGRERTEKLLDRHQVPLLSTSQLELLISEIAQEMWNQETRELDRRSLREVGEYVLAVEGVSEAAQQVVLERIPSMVMLAPGEAGGVSFEHEVFFYYFLSKTIVSRLTDRGDLRVILSRSSLPSDVTSRVARHLLWADRAQRDDMINLICTAAGVYWKRTQQVKENGGALIAAVFRRLGPAIDSVRVDTVVFPGEKFGRIDFSDCVFTGVEFRRVDLSKTVFMHSEMSACILHDVVVDPVHTKLDVSGLDVRTSVLGLRVIEGDTVHSIYDPAEVSSVLERCGLRVEHAADEQIRVPTDVKSLIERVARVYAKRNLLCKQDENLEGIFNHQWWSELERLLLKHDLVVAERRATSGPARDFLRRRFLPEEFMAGLNRDARIATPIREFWAELETLTNN